MAQIFSKTSNARNEIAEIDQSINSYLERIDKTTSEEVITVYEEKLAALKKQKTILEDSLSRKQNRAVTFETALNVVCEFIENPIKLWESDDFADKKLVQRLVFDGSIPYKLGFGFETAKISLPFEVFSLCEAPNSHLVEMAGVKPASKEGSEKNCSRA